MNITTHYIRTLLLMLLLVGGAANEAWAATRTVTYHVITLPFGDNTGYYDKTDPSNPVFVNVQYRIEAIKKTVTCDSEDEIILPADLKSPLMKYGAYSYYDAVNQSGLINIFPDNDSKFYTYDFIGKTPLASGTKVGDRTNIYVTYIWDDNYDNLKEEYGKRLDLTGDKTYNIEFSTSAGKWFYALNMDNDRGNRGQSVPAEYINGLADLCSDAPVRIKQPARNKYNFYFKWKLTNNDPYNIILKTATNTGIDYTEDGYKKNNGGAQYYGSLESSTKVRSNWVTNEVNKVYYDKSEKKTYDRHGWFRGLITPWGRNGRDNGAINHLFFSLSLLNRSTASEGDYTLAASWVNVDGDDWVPNSSGQYLLMQHEPVHDLPYAGVKFMDFSATDQVKFHEIRDYTYKVKTSFYDSASAEEKTNHVLSAHLKWSDYGKDSLLINYVPAALKRKYTSITGTYTTEAFNVARATFFDLYENDEPEIKKVRDVWLKYSVSPTIPFEVGNISTNFEDFKWYNIYVNKEEKYTTWFDTSDGNKFNTQQGVSGHTKYAHESHFAFIGDPYELYVVNRDASENNVERLGYLRLDATIANPLSCTNAYNAVADGTTLTGGNTYYTSATGAGEFTASGDEVSDGTNYFEKIASNAFTDVYYAVPDGTTLTAGKTYYTSSTGAGGFTAGGTEVSDGTNYFEKIVVPFVAVYYAVPNGTTLTAGKTYYTSSAGDGEFTALGTEVSNGSNYFEKKNGCAWEIIFDNNTGDYAGCFRLRQLNTYDAPVTIGWGSSGNRPLNGDGSGGSTMARLSVLELPMMYYYYYVVDKNGRIAVMAKEEQITGTTLNYEAIPEIIRSPFLALGAADRLTFWTYKNSSLSTLTVGMKVTLGDGSGDFEKITTTNSVEANEYRNHIFVSYDTSKLTALSENPLDDNNEHAFNVLLNGKYIYYDNGTIKSVSDLVNIPSGVDADNARWVLGGGDPYAMTIRNLGADQYVNVASWQDNADLGWVSSSASASEFIIKSSSADHTFEVMAATSVASKHDDTLNKDIVDFEHSVDASHTYYNIGRPNDNVVKLYSNASYVTGYDVLRFQLIPLTAHPVTYHLIDKYKQELLKVTIRQIKNDKPTFPAQYVSPLVKKYYYYLYDNFNVSVGADKSLKTADDIYELKTDPVQSEVAAIDDEGSSTDNIYVLYDANDLVDMNHTTMYLLKYEQGDIFRQEDGSDGLLDDPSTFTGSDAEKKAIYQAVYPYCNGDGNFFVYGQHQYDLQQEGAASTRTRWAWYVQSSNHDPYHVKILSRQTETYDGLERSGYFATRKFEGYDEVVTSLVWPNISGVLATDYMVLGNVGQYQLVTSYELDLNGDGDTEDEDEVRYVVNSFEQYWKTYDTVKKKLLSDLLPLCEEKERTDRTDGSIEVPTSPSSLRERLTKKISEGGLYEFHSYQKMANAKRWNGYNASGEKKKGWESREHWFQTVKMGSGYFDLIPTTISPAMILLDQHGWEIMRKPLPYSDQDPDKEAKKDVLRTYDSPMVKEYIFWASAKKRSGFHQYYLMDKRIGGSDFSSTSLGDLPPWGSENVVDAKGNQYDQYVTYIVKEEYATSYNPSTKAGAEFLISQGNSLAKKGETGDKITVGPNPGSTSQYIIDNIVTPGLSNELWYVKPNADIDNEMGYGTTSHNWSADNPNAYEDAAYKNNQVASIIQGASDNAAVTKFGRFSFSNGFDPYNIQISSKNDAKYFTLKMTSSKAEEGAMLGDYSGTGGSTAVILADKASTTVVGNGYDNSKWAMTNQTFMAVQDAEGNIQLMPRFDHNLRMRDFATLVTPTAEAGDKDKLSETYTYLYRPFVYNYRIIDNEGRESLRYQSGGDLLPQTPDHFKSPLAKDFKYYKSLTETDGVYNEVKNKANISSKEITASLAGAGLTTPSVTDGNIVYVRYDYDEDADVQHILQGKWLTMQLNEKDAVYNAGIKEFDTNGGSDPRPNPIDGNTHKAWQWKFLRNPYSDPDPYAVQLFNRNAEDLPMRTPVLGGGTVGTSVSIDDYQRFALLSHSADGYALTVAGTKSDEHYYFLNGGSMSTSIAAITSEESGFNGSTCEFVGKNSQILLTDEVVNTYMYKVYTNGGVEAISDTQSQNEAADYGFVPTLPDAIKTPLLNIDQFRYYEALTDTAYNSGKALKNLYGLYDGAVYVRYNAYDPHTSEYKVPNERNTPGTTVAKGEGSNDAPLRLDGKLPHNIIWYNDNMMKAGKTGDVYSTIIDGGSLSLQNEADYSWTFAGDDPYAIMIRHKSSGKYVHQKSEPTTECDLDASATTFMLLNREGYEYGVLATTGNKDVMLSGYGNALVTDDLNPETTSDNPTKFIIFSLGTLKVVYHLVLANIGEYQPIPHRARDVAASYTTGESDCWNTTDGKYSVPWSSTAPIDTIWVHGTTKRELSNSVYNLGDTGGVFYPDWEGNISSTDKTLYCKDVGPISLGDALAVPTEFYRPNVNYFFVVRQIGGGTPEEETDLNKKYKGLQLTSNQMSMNEDLIGKIIYIDIVYSFNTDLESNSGDDFVRSISQNKWYTLETVIDGKTYLAQYTNAWGFELKEGRGSHFTNDFLWTPIGDPYGFQLVNRYMDVNSGDHNLGEKNRAITTIPTNITIVGDQTTVDGAQVGAFDNQKQIVMGNYAANDRVVRPGASALSNMNHDIIMTNSIYELLESNTLGFFRFHPVANTSNQTQVYFNPEWADDNGDGTDEYLIRLKTTAVEFTFGLSAELMKPYFDRAGYVGGLTKEAYNKAANAALVAAMKADNPVLTAAQLMQAQALVYDSENVVQFKNGYYRLHSPLGLSGIDPARYVSGYTHKIELTGDGELTHSAIPMHFYEEDSNRQRQFTDFKDGGFIYSAATRGDLPILPVERDPASIFYFQKIPDGEIPGAVADEDKDRYNLGTISTQGLYIKGAKGQVTILGTTPPSVSNTDPNKETADERPAAVMTADEEYATRLFVMDIGGGILLIHDNVTALGRQYLKYLSYDYSRDTEDNSTIYDMKLTNHTHTDHAKFCMQPVQNTATKGVNEMPLKLNLNNGGDGYYYATFCAPYDVLLTDADNDAAFICKVWDTELIHLKKVGKYNIEADGCPPAYAGSNQFVPAGTPVIIRSKNTSVTMALPTNSPSTTLADNYKLTGEGKASNIFSGVYLEQLLSEENGSNDVYVFGLPFTGTATKDEYYYSSGISNNGQITISLPQHEEKGVGFYINANYNRESKADMGSWIRNNRYVYNNRIYYRTPGGGGAHAPRQQTTSMDFIPVVFDDDEEEEGGSDYAVQRDQRMYDLQGRLVWSPSSATDKPMGLRPGIYIVGGRKVTVR